MKNFLEIEVEKTGSTQELAKELSLSAKGEFSVSAITQTRGYGRRGTRWFSDKGGLYLTIFLKRKMRADDLKILSLKTAEAVRKYLESISIDAQIKEPNDLVVLHNGIRKKICGILIETVRNGEEYHIYAGIGLNINNKPPKICPAISVARLLKKEIDIKSARRAITALVREAL